MILLRYETLKIHQNIFIKGLGNIKLRERGKKARGYKPRKRERAKECIKGEKKGYKEKMRVIK